MIYAFEEFELDEDGWELKDRGTLVETPPKVLEILSYLLRHRRRVVAKSELVRAVWGTLTVTEASLNNAVSLVRRCLRDDGKRQRLIRTARSRGYRFVGAVRTTAPLEVSALEEVVPEHVPRRIVDIILERVNRLSQEERALLVRAARPIVDCGDSLGVDHFAMMLLVALAAGSAPSQDFLQRMRR
jgi:DNA-binding winged helix-turn-helix (wHTH) protein